MTKQLLLGLQERKRELTIKRNYAFERYMDADAKRDSAIRVISKVGTELMEIEKELKKLKDGQSMQVCDAAWVKKNGPRAEL